MTHKRPIYWVHEFFYLESMMACVASALASAEIIANALAKAKSDLTQEQFLDSCQNIIQQAAAISRYFWPAPNPKSKYVDLHRRRGALLRAVFQITDDNPLKDRNLRNRIEHFDENLDIYLSGLVAGDFVPAYVGPTPNPKIPTEYFRAFFTDAGVFEVLGESYAIQPLCDELSRLHALLAACADNGFRFPELPYA